MTPGAASGSGTTPTFLVIGAARSGTTFLARQLDRHPDVAVSDPKEPHFLAYPNRPLAFTGPGDAETINRVGVTQLDAWRRLFDPAAPARGEGSVSTLYRAEVAVGSIAEHCPDAKLIVVLREPVDRAYSAWLYQVGKGYESEDFERALELEPDRIAAGWHHMWHYEAMGHYGAQLRPFVEAFGRDRLLVLEHEQLQEEPDAALDACFAHLGVGPTALSAQSTEVNRGGTPRNRTLATAMRQARRAEPLRCAVKALVPFGVRERIRAANLERPPMPTGARQRLREAYAEDQAALVDLLGTDAPVLGPVDMRILQLHNTQRQRGGADVVLERERAELEGRHHEVDTMIVATEDVERRGPLQTGLATLWNGRAVRELRRRLTHDRPDVVHLHTPFPVMSPAVIQAASRAGLPVVVTSHSWRFSCANGLLYRDGDVCEDCVGRRLKHPAVRHRCYHEQLLPSLAVAGSLTAHHAAGTFAHHVDRFLALTPFMRERLIAEGLAPGRVLVKPNSAPDPGPPRTQRDGYLLFAGRLATVKGIDVMLEAWRHLDLDVRLVIAGDGPEAERVARAAASDPRIEARGWLDATEVTDLLAGAEAALLPSSWYEGLPIALTEALAAGTPVIVSDVGNFCELVTERRDGVRFRAGDPEDLAEAVRWLVQDADRAALRRGARTTWEEHYAPGPVLDQLEAVYRLVIEERRQRAGGWR